jgi:hypothetical protein
MSETGFENKQTKYELFIKEEGIAYELKSRGEMEDVMKEIGEVVKEINEERIMGGWKCMEFTIRLVEIEEVIDE